MYTCPDVVGTVEGWRMWLFDGARLTGTGIGQYYKWPIRKPAVAEHPGEDGVIVVYYHPAGPLSDPLRHPEGLCGQCGLYAAKSKELVEPRLPITAGMTPTIIFGKVSLWGEIWEHKWGYRAQYGYPTLFYDCHIDGVNLIPPAAMALASDVYRIPVEVLDVHRL